jgi:hypothetical protein
VTGLASFSDFTAAGKLSVVAGATPNIICPGTLVNLSASPAGGVPPYNYAWSSNPAGFTSTLQNPTVNPAVTTIYTVVVTDVRSHTASSSATVTVNPNLPASVSISASANPVCTATSVTFTAIPVNGGTGPSYQWKLNGNNVGTNSSAYTNGALADGDVILCIMTSNASCVTGSPATSNSITMSVGSPSVSVVTTETCLRGSTGTITASGTGGQPPYTYRLNAGAYQASGLFTGLAAGTYTITVRDNITCTGTTTATVLSPAPSGDDQTAAGADSWTGHVYDGTNFNSYFGHYTEPELFDENFGGDNNCFTVTSSSQPRSILTAQYSVRYRMNSTRRGLYIVDLGSDDGSRLTLDGSLIYNNWSDQSFSTGPGC